MSRTSRQRDLIIGVVVLTLVTEIGCSPTIRMPDLFHPGSAQQQRAEALDHDPYPLDDAGPAIVGGRPPGYERPVPEVERARAFFSKLPGTGRASTYISTPTIQSVPTPYVTAPLAQPAPQSYAPLPISPPAQTTPTPPPFRY